MNFKLDVVKLEFCDGRLLSYIEDVHTVPTPLIQISLTKINLAVMYTDL